MKKIIILIVLALLLTYLIWALKIVFISQSGKGITKPFTIVEGEGVHQISRGLKTAGLIDNSFIFETYLWFINGQNKVLAGDHLIYDKWSIRTLARVLISGSALENEKIIKVIEGWNLYNISKYFVDQEIVSQEEFFELVGKPLDSAYNRNLPLLNTLVKKYEFLKELPFGSSLEGYLFPDTYRVYKNAEAIDVIKKMLDNFGSKITERMRADIKEKQMTLHEIITLASILEKEEKTLEDKKMVSGIYYNRLKIGMALQADPTVNYITGKKNGGPSPEDLKIKNPYNTYKYRGLPPGPICNPGLDSIMAAIYPTKSGYLYFYNAPDGRLYLAKTLEEHNNNIQNSQ
jgi:UPF0755 protein